MTFKIINTTPSAAAPLPTAIRAVLGPSLLISTVPHLERELQVFCHNVSDSKKSNYLPRLSASLVVQRKSVLVDT